MTSKQAIGSNNILSSHEVRSHYLNIYLRSLQSATQLVLHGAIACFCEERRSHYITVLLSLFQFLY
ncbi:hypothetical protein [Chroococcidiopsis cubana]|uniref:hypothetical protein n=1 Tax=Chroococcidiopsis cubana TaxID=171392 RepID=UPI0011B1E94E|nr:hypothetical protein [Chroococcidiopsis cubana]